MTHCGTIVELLLPSFNNLSRWNLQKICCLSHIQKLHKVLQQRLQEGKKCYIQCKKGWMHANILINIIIILMVAMAMPKDQSKLVFRVQKTCGASAPLNSKYLLETSPSAYCECWVGQIVANVTWLMASKTERLFACGSSLLECQVSNPDRVYRSHLVKAPKMLSKCISDCMLFWLPHFERGCTCYTLCWRRNMLAQGFKDSLFSTIIDQWFV